MLYLKRPLAKSWELRRCVGALLGSRPGGLWDFYLDEPVLILCEYAIAVRALGFQLRIAERMVMGRCTGESGAHHHTAF